MKQPSHNPAIQLSGQFSLQETKILLAGAGRLPRVLTGQRPAAFFVDRNLPCYVFAVELHGLDQRRFLG